MLEKLKEEVYKANMDLPKYGLVTFTWGNVSEIDREKEIVAIKPSGVEYSKMTAEDIVLVDLEGNILEGELRPSSDVDTHLEFYRNWPGIGVLYIHIPHGQPAGHRQEEIFHVMEQRTRTIFTERFHVCGI